MKKRKTGVKRCKTLKNDRLAMAPAYR